MTPINRAQEIPLASLEDEIATLSATIQAATFQLLGLIGELDRRGGWGADPLAPSGFRSAAHWLSWRVGLDLGAARQYVRVARALPDLPLISEAFSRGEVSYSKVRAITRIADPDNEETLLGWALAGTASQVERLVRTYRRANRLAENEHALAQEASRRLTCYFDDDGMLVVNGRLSPEQGALLMKALEVSRDELHGLERVSAEPLPARDPAPMKQDGPVLSAETARRLACDATVCEMRHGPNGELEPGRKTRAVSAALRRALLARDGTRCAFPGCGCRARDAHHVVPWGEEGPTLLPNLLGVCKLHHVLVHEGGWRVEAMPNGRFRFLRPDGTEVLPAPPLPAMTYDPVVALHKQWMPPGATFTPESGLPTWQGETVDYEWATQDLLWRAEQR